MFLAENGEKRHLKPYLLENLGQLENWLAAIGEPAFRAGQIQKWLFDKRAVEFDQMTDLPGKLRTQLANDFTVWSGQVVKHDVSADGTEKLLSRLHDKQTIESVLLRDGRRRTICVSSQVGCAMGCVFCASGLDGVARNLSAAEIVEQMLRLASLLPADERLSHIVMMGMGEPLANLESVQTALEIAASQRGLGISPRRITISTVGIPESILKLAERNSRFHLAVSLHAPTDELRDQLVPINRKIGIRRILDAADRYFEISGRRLTFEYVLLSGINDQMIHAKQLSGLLKSRNALLNVIPYNPVAGLPYRTPSPAAVQRFKQTLQAAGIRIKFRQRKGNRINAACGQLRRDNRYANGTFVEAPGLN